METGEVKTWGDNNYITGGEPVFIAAPDAKEEDDGKLHSYEQKSLKGTAIV